jgi:hypothetical protein
VRLCGAGPGLYFDFAAFIFHVPEDWSAVAFVANSVSAITSTASEQPSKLFFLIIGSPLQRISEGGCRVMFLFASQRCPVFLTGREYVSISSVEELVSGLSAKNLAFAARVVTGMFPLCGMMNSGAVPTLTKLDIHIRSLYTGMPPLKFFKQRKQSLDSSTDVISHLWFQSGTLKKAASRIVSSAGMSEIPCCCFSRFCTTCYRHERNRQIQFGYDKLECLSFEDFFYLLKIPYHATHFEAVHPECAISSSL